MNSLLLTIPGVPPGGNELHRMGPWAVRQSRAEWRAKAEEEARLLIADCSGVLFPFRKVAIMLIWCFPKRRRRDYDNLFAGIKPVLDGLVSGGVIEDDDSDHLVGLSGSIAHIPTAPGPYMILTIKEVP